MKVTYHYSACITIDTPDLKILCDPWFTEGIYHGSWYHYPVPQTEPAEADYIYISHLHPDHLDIPFLKRMFPDKSYLIAERQGVDYLRNMLERNGLRTVPISGFDSGKTTVEIIPETESVYGIDSVMIVKYGNQSLLNLNDVILTQKMVDKIKEMAPNITCLLMNYQAASPFPQQYHDAHNPILLGLAAEKHTINLLRYLGAEELFKPEISVPFAGQYLLGGKNYWMNGFRGAGDDTDVLHHSKTAVVLNEDGFIDLDTLKVDGVRYLPYEPEAMALYSLGLSTKLLDYETYEPDTSLNLKSAFNHAMETSNVKSNLPTCIRTPAHWFCIKSDVGEFKILDVVDEIYPRMEIYPDPRLLHGLLTKKFHWNNAYVGSLYPIRTYGDRFIESDQSAMQFLNYFHE